MARTPYHTISTRATPQTDPIPGTAQNSAGGHSFPVDDWTRLRRFLILGSEGGSYYASEQSLTKENARALARCIKSDGLRTVREITEISVAGRNPKQQPVMFALAMCAGADNPLVRQAALDALPQVCRTGTHLFLFASYVEQFRGWGRSLRRAIGDWYLLPHTEDIKEDDTDADNYERHVKWVALQVSKYQQREGWSHRDLLRLAKPPHWNSAKAKTLYSDHPSIGKVLGWAAGKPQDDLHPYLAAVEAIKGETNAKRAVKLIEEHRLPWESVPSELLANPAVWEAMVPNLGIGALVRNLGRMTANGLIKPMSAVEQEIVARLTDELQIMRSRIHPIAVLSALTTYGAGKGVKGSLAWNPTSAINEALEDAFKLSFGNVEPANKRTLIALDVSGSMSWSNIAGTQFTPRVGSAAMALITVATEPLVHTMAFSHDLVPVNINKRSSLNSTLEMMDKMGMGGTDCSLPMQHATREGIDVDTFVVYTDSETWAGRNHPVQALRKYRDKTGIDAKLIVVGMVSNGFTIADPTDGGMLDVVGFDTAAPAVMADFSAGRL